MEGDTVYLPAGTTYCFGIGNGFLPQATTTSGWTVYGSYTNFGGDPAPGVVKELDLLGSGVGVIVNGIPFQSSRIKVRRHTNVSRHSAPSPSVSPSWVLNECIACGLYRVRNQIPLRDTVLHRFSYTK